MNLNIVALDLSLTATGVATRGEIMTLTERSIPKGSPPVEYVKRLHRMSARIDRICRVADIVVIEGPSFGSSSAFAHDIGGLHGLVDVILLQREIPFAIVPPSSLKKYALGVGGGKNATKELVLQAAARKTNHTFRNNNESDAFWLWQLAACHYQHPYRVVMPQRNEEALKAIVWPALEEREEQRVG